MWLHLVESLSGAGTSRMVSLTCLAPQQGLEEQGADWAFPSPGRLSSFSSPPNVSMVAKSQEAKSDPIRSYKSLSLELTEHPFLHILLPKMISV